MTVLKLVGWKDPVLTTPAQKYDFSASAQSYDLVELCRAMVDTMIAHGGHGLAAPQVGVPLRVVVIRATPNIAMVNPIIVDSVGVHTLQEACLSYPGLVLRVERAQGVKVRYTRPNGEVVTEKYGGLTARAIQHELDHLDGKTILSSTTGVQRIMAMKKWGKACRIRKTDDPVRVEGELTLTEWAERGRV